MLPLLLTGTRSSLGKILKVEVKLQGKFNGDLPLVVDMKNFYSMVKFLYSATYDVYPLCYVLCCYLTLYSVWHRYTYCCEAVYMPLSRFTKKLKQFLAKFCRFEGAVDPFFLVAPAAGGI